MPYWLQDIIHYLTPFLGFALSVIIGILVDRAYWKPRIYRYADREIVKTLEYQKNKIAQLEEEKVKDKTLISDLRGFIKLAKKSAVTIIQIPEA